MDRKEVSFIDAARWFDRLSELEKSLARVLMLTTQRDYGYTFDKALQIVCESYLMAREDEKKRDKDSLDMDDATIALLRKELNGKKGN